MKNALDRINQNLGKEGMYLIVAKKEKGGGSRGSLFLRRWYPGLMGGLSLNGRW